MPHRSIAQLVVLALLLLPAVGASACEYCVREVGFVPLNDEPFRVVIAVPPDTSDAERDRLLAEARAALGPGNVVVSVGSPEEGGLFADAARQSGGALPASVVQEPGGRTHPLLPFATDSESPGDALVRSIGSVTHSRARDGLAAALIDGFATVLIVEGTDEGANAAARELAEQAIQRINAVKSGFDRVIEVGPALRVITAEERGAEHWLLWSLGIDSGEEPMPSVAVLYGKGRRLGDVLTGNTLTDDRLFTLLSYVARDCECDLDRGWLYGTTIPLVWDDALRRRVYDALGFDPESAATRAAVARILERGPGTPGSGGANARDPFLEDSGTATGIPGLTIHNLGDPTTNVPPPVTVADAGPDDHADADSDNARPDVAPDAPPAATAAQTPDPLRPVLSVLGAFAAVVLLAGAVVLLRARGRS